MKIELPIRLRSAVLPAIGVAASLGLLTTLMAAFVPVRGPDASLLPEPVAEPLDEADVEAAREEVRFDYSPTWTPVDVYETAPTAPQRVEPGAVLRAIAHVETAGDSRRIGRHGERGMYQFRQTTWRQHTRSSFSQAHNPEVATTVAHRHYDWIVQSLRAKGLEGTPYEVALAWNAGLSRVLSGRAPSRSHHYAQRVANLAADF